MAQPYPVPQAPTSLRVAIVAASLRILGGQAVQARRMLEGWRDDPAVDAWLVPIDPRPPRPFDRLLAVKYLRTLVTQFFYWPLLVRELRRADVVHVFSASYASFLLSPLPAILVAKALGKPVVLNYHSGEAADHLSRSRFARHVLRSWVDVVAVPSTYLRGVFAQFGIAAEVVSNTLDLQQFTFRSRDPLRPRLLCTRNLEANYNVACVLRAFARVQAQYPAASLVLVGSGSMDADLRQLATSLRLEHVTFVGRVEPSVIPHHYADADIYVQTPAVDNMPLSVLEAFASGLPVISTRVGGIPAILTPGVHGILTDPDDDEAIARGVVDLLEHPDQARRLAAAAHATCTAYEWSGAREGWLAVYRAAMDGRRRQEAPVENPT